MDDTLIVQLIKDVGTPSAIAVFALWILGRGLRGVEDELRQMRREVREDLAGIRGVLEGRRRGDDPLRFGTLTPGR